ncbi:MAG: sulfatase, partial [Bacteroidales bacterium]|nr:sulfatase [Bacteroidales bacterium]
MNTKSLKVLTIALICCLSTLNAQKNVLFIMADDFNHWLPEIGYYPDAKTPNLSKLANTGVLFSRAYVPSPVCNPSRNAIMSGLRPSTSGITSNGGGYIREIPGLENWVTMNQYFTQNGYYTYAGGKIYHPGGMDSHESDKENWSDIYKHGSGARAGKAYAWAVPGCDGKLKWSGSTDGIELAGRDTDLANHMAKKIEEYNQSKPFFMACGLFRPHLPWNCPKEFYDLYDLSELTVPPPGYKDNGKTSCDHQGIVENGKWAEAIRAYLANMSYADYNVGILLDALERSGKADNTIVLFMGDHGWHLGEKNRWRKASTWEHANHTTLIIYDPSAEGNGKVCKKVVNLQDLYPTLVELCELPHNSNVEGNSLEPLLEDPGLAEWDHPSLIKYRDTEILRTENWKFVNNGNFSELYDANTDINEHYNLYGNSEYDEVVAELRHRMDSIRQIGQDILANATTCNG